MSRSADTYYPSIDSLRAVAVLSVIFFHLNAELLPGGFVGVDVFFVISGFVVSLSMAKLRASSLTSFTTHFYARRLLRIAPALLVCLLVTAWVSCLFIPRAWLSEFNRQTGMAAFWGFSNFVLAQHANDYFSPRAEFNPFTHTWSLAVEEQFYLVFPVLMYFFTRPSSRQAGRRSAVWALAALCAASLVCCAWWTITRPTQAFYLLPARFWELGCGMGLLLTRSLWQPALASWNLPRARVVGCALLAGLAVSLVFAEARAFPFPWAIVPVVCTTGLLALITGRSDRALPSSLYAAPVVWVGKISYSLYLWHWPVFVLFRWTVGIEAPSLQLLAVVLTFALAVLSYHWIELPLRFSKRARVATRWRVVAVGLTSVALASVVASQMFKKEPHIALSVTTDKQTWWPDSVLRPENGIPACQLDTGSQPLAGGTVQTFKPKACANAGHLARMFVVGDSHAWAYSAMLRHYAEQSGREVRLITKGGCAMFNLVQPMATDSEACQQFTEAALQELSVQTRAGDLLFLPSLRVPRIRDQWGGAPPRPTAQAEEASRQAASAEAGRVLKTLADKGVQVIFEAPKPIFKAPPFRCADWFNATNPICKPGFDMARDEMQKMREPALVSIRNVSAGLIGATTWDPLPTLCPAATCSAFLHGKPLYFDGDHLSGLGNALLVQAFANHVAALTTTTQGNQAFKR